MGAILPDLSRERGNAEAAMAGDGGPQTQSQGKQAR
jgi:hypothetical protein